MTQSEIFPVVHVNDRNQSLRQAGIAFEAGADGVYLIDHHQRTQEYLMDISHEVKHHYPGQFVGVNLLLSGLRSFRTILQSYQKGKITDFPDAVWVDEAATDMKAIEQYRLEHQELKNVRYLGGVAFKYTRDYTDDPGKASELARNAIPYVDVITTSGPGTGESATPEKTKAMKRTIGDHALALASGVTPENIHLFTDHVDQILVASSIETAHYSGEFDATKLGALMARLKK